ncbi:hypothetical protein HBZC1_17300 [Helicobacter bizzozeronii CIII-1]|uniref:Uncharacterized protein n=1 Tax=Helicobacter bizzozeronii (strain CIII-1) TaxID=1002804 RepID=F8KPJ2_HELBC|nr:hypothetical protein [Helicobacter bizzozeronii]CCB80716.1 hypothetical protein HBZC1_17300 [Helicobacter bizzozeronii CIII-1]
MKKGSVVAGTILFFVALFYSIYEFEIHKKVMEMSKNDTQRAIAKHRTP